MSCGSLLLRLLLAVVCVALLSIGGARGQVVSSAYLDAACTQPYGSTLDILAVAAALPSSAVNQDLVNIPGYCTNVSATSSGVWNCYGGYQLLDLVWWPRNTNCNGYTYEPYGSDYNVTTLSSATSRNSSSQCMPARYTRYNAAGSITNTTLLYLTYQCYNTSTAPSAASAHATLVPLLAIAATLTTVLAMAVV